MWKLIRIFNAQPLVSAVEFLALSLDRFYRTDKILVMIQLFGVLFQGLGREPDSEYHLPRM